MGLSQANEQREIQKFVLGLLDRMARLEDRIRQIEANEDSNFNVISNQSITGTIAAVEVLNRTVKKLTMGNDGTVGFKVTIVTANPTAGAADVTIAATFGGVSVFSRTESITNHASSRATLEVIFYISNAVSTTVQRTTGRYENTPIAATGTLTAFTNQMKLWGTAAINTEVDQNLIVTVQNADTGMISRVTASYYIKPLPLSS